MATADTHKIRLARDVEDIAAAVQVFSGIWGGIEVKANLVRAIQHAGGYVAVVEGPGHDVIGASVAFRGQHEGRPSLHSHITGVLPEHRGVGVALKAHQRQWSAQNGVEVITWTFDPLVARNSWFNLHKLSVQAPAYMPDHYGEMQDGVNAGTKSDRLLAVWPVDGRTDPSPHGEPVLLLDVGGDGEPVLRTELSAAQRRPVLVRLPADVEQMRRSDQACARRWRDATRAVLMAAYQAGYRATDAVRDGGIILTRIPEAPR